MPRQMTSIEFNQFLLDQKQEIEKYKLELGIRFPLQYRTINDICDEWVTLFADNFRNEWQRAHNIV